MPCLPRRAGGGLQAADLADWFLAGSKGEQIYMYLYIYRGLGLVGYKGNVSICTCIYGLYRCIFPYFLQIANMFNLANLAKTCLSRVWELGFRT